MMLPRWMRAPADAFHVLAFGGKADGRFDPNNVTVRTRRIESEPFRTIRRHYGQRALLVMESCGEGFHGKIKSSTPEHGRFPGANSRLQTEFFSGFAPGLFQRHDFLVFPYLSFKGQGSTAKQIAVNVGGGTGQSAGGARPVKAAQVRTRRHFRSRPN